MNIRSRVDYFVDKFFGLYYNTRGKNKVPKPRNHLVLESATSLARRIRNGEITSEEVVRAFIERIQQVNPLINAVVDQRFEEALQEAQDLDKNITCGNITEEAFQKQPLLGVPFTLKEAIAATGLSHTFGLISRKNCAADYDAIVVTRIKQAGAILLGVTNIPQMSAWYETANPLYGLTCNPYDLTRTAGGSSGGEASIVAACGSPLGIGTDLGGSLRNPAFMCGIFAHKPTSGVVSVNGVLFNNCEKLNTMASIGPLVKHSEDLIPVLKILISENEDRLRLDEVVDWDNVKIYYVLDPKDPYVSPIRPEMDEVFEKVVDYFEGRVPTKLLELEELKFGGLIWHYWIGQESNIDSLSDFANREGELSRMFEFTKFLLRRSDFNLGAMFAILGGLLPSQDPNWALQTTNLLTDSLTEILGSNGVLLYPSCPFPASYHHTTTFRPCNANLFSIWNALKFCVTQVPLGLNSQGLPVGIQVVGAPFQDHLTIAVARELEKGFGGYVPPFDPSIIN